MRLDVTTVDVGSNPYKPSALVGDPTTMWKDGSDASYAEVWASVRSSETYGTMASGPVQLAPEPSSSITEIKFGIRFSTANEQNAQGGYVAAWLETLAGGYVCDVQGPWGDAELRERPTVEPSPVTVLRTLGPTDYSDSGTNLGTVALRLTQGVRLRIGRYTSPYNPPADFQIKVYEAWLEVGLPEIVVVDDGVRRRFVRP